MLAQAQVPDLQIHFDLKFSYRTQQDGPTTLRLYDPLGHFSTVKLRFDLEPGFQLYLAQKLQRIPGDPDGDLFDEYFVEDAGHWRVGKQYLPFGGQLYRESVLAVRSDTAVSVEKLPLSLAACDGGPGRQRGIVGSLGDELRVSFAVGKRFAINSTALTLIRNPEDTPGEDRGYGSLLGFNLAKGIGNTNLKAEYLLLRSGETAADRERDLLDLSATLGRDPKQSLTLGWTHDDLEGNDFYRILGDLRVLDQLAIQPMVRLINGRGYDFSLTMNVKF